MSPSDESVDFIPLNIAVLTISDTRDELTDKSGKLLAERLEAAGPCLFEKRIEIDHVYKSTEVAMVAFKARSSRNTSMKSLDDPSAFRIRRDGENVPRCSVGWYVAPSLGSSTNR